MSGDNPAIVDERATARDAVTAVRLYLDDDTTVWRIHIPRIHWQDAWSHDVIALGWQAPTDGNAKSFSKIRAGDRIVTYLQKGMIGGIGIVRAAYDPANPQAGTPAALFGGAYPERIIVDWADAPTAPVDLSSDLGKAAHELLRNRIRNPTALVRLLRAYYSELLTLLGVDDPAPGSDPALETAIVPVLQLWRTLAEIVAFARALEPRPYRVGEVHEGYLRSAGALRSDIEPDELAQALGQLRLVRADADRMLVPHRYAGAAADAAALARLITLAVLIDDDDDDTYTLPARTIVPQLAQGAAVDFAPHLASLREWYIEAGLLEPSGVPTASARDRLPGTDRASAMYNQLLDALIAEATAGAGVMPHIAAEAPLPMIVDLDHRLNELASEMLIDRSVVLRIVRSLLAGRHVVLSGPPGTGKTELAKKLPELLWRSAPEYFVRVTDTLDYEPVETFTEQRHGYAPILTTATEDWGVRDVIGGIGPQLSDGRLGYTIDYGVLTRTLLRHYAHTSDGAQLPPPADPRFARRDYQANGRRYRGAWLIIDEFTRAPVDAAFGSLLTTLGGGGDARLTVPSADGVSVELPLPADFRIIGTLNSFDRHFLNQISEALKRRFDFIDVLPPARSAGVAEQGIVLWRALGNASRNGLVSLTIDIDTTKTWQDVVMLSRSDTTDSLMYAVVWSDSDAEAHFAQLYRVFAAVRVFRQVGTAQLIASATNLISGQQIGMGWRDALDAALADSLADQLQVLTPDEQEILLAACTQDAAGRSARLTSIFESLPTNRKRVLLAQLASVLGAGIDPAQDAAPTELQVTSVFGAPIELNPEGLFARRVRAFADGRGA